MAGIWKSLFGSGGKVKQANTMNPQQMQLQQQLMQGLQGGQSNLPGMEWLQQLLNNDPEAFAAYEAPAMRQFQQEIVPGIAERFSGMGMGAQGSSAFQQQLASAGGRLSQDLAGQRAGLRQGAMSQLQGLYGQAMQPSFQNFYQQPTQGLIPGMVGGIGQGAGYAAGNMFGGSAMQRLMGGGYGGNQYGNQQYGQGGGYPYNWS